MKGGVGGAGREGEEEAFERAVRKRHGGGLGAGGTSCGDATGVKAGARFAFASSRCRAMAGFVRSDTWS